MAAEAMTLPEDREAAGRRILELTDSVGFDATGAGWVFTRSSGAWRFFLFSAMADTKGSRWIWERLALAFARLHLPEGITPLDIVVESPNEALYRSIWIKVGIDVQGVAMTTVFDVSGSGHGIDKIWLLRARPEASLLRDVASRAAAARRFDTSVRRLMAA